MKFLAALPFIILAALVLIGLIWDEAFRYTLIVAIAFSAFLIWMLWGLDVLLRT